MPSLPSHRRGAPVCGTGPLAFGRLAAAVALVSLGACAEGPAHRELDLDPDPHEPGARIRALLDGASEPVLAIHTGDTVRLSPEVGAFYERRDFAPAWTDGSGLRPGGESLMRAIHEAAEDGLDPRRYHDGLVQEMVARTRREHGQGLALGGVLGTLDLLLTEAALRFTADLVRGTVDPEAAGLPWLIPGEDVDGGRLLDRLTREEDVGVVIDSLRPTAPFYHHLRRAMVRYQAVVQGGGWPSVSEHVTLEPGAQGPGVLALRARLAAEGDPGEAPFLSPAADPARYDAGLARAVESFQRRHGLEPDGAVGTETLRELNVPAEERLLAIRLNLDRWRWLPRDLGRRYLLVNVAGFELAVMEDDEAVLRMSVVVGQQAWKTPLFQDTVKYVVVNPYWNVPSGIAGRDIIPAAVRDRGYLARNGFEVLDRSGRRVDPYWVDLRSDRYRIRQRPGAHNALGAVKFLFPNAMDIYLHDTPARHLFSQTSRAFSNGCIRVEKPRELAEYLLRTSTSHPPGTYDKLRATGREQWVTLKDKLPIYILYFTAWAEADGRVHFHQDIYRRDEDMRRLAHLKLTSPS